MTVQAKHFYAFGPFRLDSEKRVLVRDGTPVPLAPKATEILLVLVEQAGHLVEKEVLINRVWPDAFVEEGNLNKNIFFLRKALGEWEGGREYIETVPKRGYRFVAPVSDVTHAEVAPQQRSASATNLVGKKVSHYRVLEILGGGGMGVVYKAEDLKLGRRVALKFLPEELGNDVTAAKRFEREARAASALDHPNICSIYEFGEHEGQPFLVMPLLEGQTLRERLSESGPLPAGTLLAIAIQIAQGLEMAHKKGIIHRDIKPTNIFITGRGGVKILDFGLAKLLSAERGTGAVQGFDREDNETRETPQETLPTVGRDLSLSRTGVAMGTAGYMSPEQLRGEKLDARTDLFSFGLVLYEMAGGRPAFTGDTELILCEATLSLRPTPLRHLNPEIPSKMETIIFRAMEKNPALRYQSASEMCADLESEADAFRHIPQNGPRVAVEEPQPSVLTNKGVSFFEGFRRSPWNWFMLAAASTTLLIAGFVLFLRAHQLPALGASDLVLVSDFVNVTGEPIFDGTLKQALSVKLAESPYFSLVPGATTRQTLSSMNRSPDERILPPIAREVCQRVGAKVVVGGSVLKVGNNYLLRLNATNCHTGANIANEEIEALDKQQVLSKLGKALPSLRRKLGESISSIQRFDTPIEQATTKSLAAFKAFTSGEEKRAQGQEGQSLPSYKLAIDLDPDFAMAYARLSAVSRSLNQIDLADEYLRKAFERREHVSDKEKFYIQARYYSDSAREPDNEIETYKPWAEIYPHDFLPFNGLASGYIEIGQLQKAIEAGQEALRLNPNHALPYASLTRAYERASRFPEAKAVCEKALAEKVDSFWTHQVLYRISFVEGDGTAMQREIDWFKGKPQESVSTYNQAKAALSLGKVRRSRELFEHARLLAEARGLEEQALAMINGEAQFEADMGNSLQARTMAELALRTIPNSSRHEAFATLALARSGDLRRAETLVDQLSKQPLLGTGLNDVIFPCIRAALALDRKNPAAAITELERSGPYDLGSDSSGITSYYRGLAYLQLKSGKEAATQFETIVNNRGVVMVDIYWPLARLGLARAYELQGDTPKALIAYKDFLTLWKDADPDIPILKEAKAEYAKLQ